MQHRGPREQAIRETLVEEEKSDLVAHVLLAVRERTLDDAHLFARKIVHPRVFIC
jgi:hypothetical protein